MTYIDYAKEARSHAAKAAGATRRAEADARHAEEFYQLAARKQHDLYRLRATWQHFPPADQEANIGLMVRIADRYLRSSFEADVRAAFYRDLAAKYRVWRDERKARTAEFEATLSAACRVYDCGSCDGTNCAHYHHEAAS